MTQLTIPQAFDLAVQHHQAGRLAEAEGLYRQVLAQEPNHTGALHLLGVLAHRVGRKDMALDLIRRAIALGPNNSDAYNNLGNVLKDCGQLEEAITAFRQAIALRPDYPEAHSNLASALREKGELEGALAACRRALALRPDLPEACYNLGNVLRDKGQPDEAIAAFRRAISLNPNVPVIHYTLASALDAVGQFDEASIAYTHAATLGSELAEIHGNLGDAAYDISSRDDAVAGDRPPLCHLDRVTLCCIDTRHPAAALRAIRHSLRQCPFNRALFFTHEAVSEPGVECHVIPRLKTGQDYSAFMIKRLASFLKTEFVLIVQWDGYIIDGSRWSDDFLKFDYIGAPWPWHKKTPVGNGGFSIRSRRLLQLLADSRLEFVYPEDLIICRVYRDHLEKRGIRFADLETASRFAVESGEPFRPTLGFHGVHNLWRYLPQQELGPLLDLLPQTILKDERMTQLLARYQSLGRHEEAAEIISRRQT